MGLRLRFTVPYIAACGGKGGMDAKGIQQTSPTSHCRVDDKYTVAQPKRPGYFVALRGVLALIIFAIFAVAAFFIENHTSSDFTRLTLKHGPAPAMWGAASPGFKSGE
jgi:hypothetical protein